MSIVDLDELERLYAATTSKPWYTQHHHEGGAGDRRSLVMSGREVIGMFDDEHVPLGQACANAEFAVAAHRALPAMIRELRAARELRDFLTRNGGLLENHIEHSTGCENCNVLRAYDAARKGES